jgi:hypothetical protein
LARAVDRGQAGGVSESKKIGSGKHARHANGGRALREG